MEALIPNATTLVQMAIFLVAFVVLKTFLFDPFLTHLEARDARTGSGADDDLKGLGERATQADSAVEAALLDARSRAAADRERLLAEAQSQVDSILADGRARAATLLAAAKAEVDHAEIQAVRDLGGVVAPLARQAAARLTGTAA